MRPYRFSTRLCRDIASIASVSRFALSIHSTYAR